MTPAINQNTKETDTSFTPAGREIFADIKSQIIRGDLKPGDHILSERKLMEIYHRSRATVREALHMLERAGFIKIIPRSGPIVLEYTGTSIGRPIEEAIEANHITLSEIREFRTVVEGEIAGWAAVRRSENDLMRIHNCVLEMKESVNDYLHFLDLDTEFHALVARASQNRACGIMLSSISSISREFTRRDLEQFSPRQRKNRCSAIYELHLAIYEKIRDQDVSGAKSAMLYHLSAFEKDLTANEEKRQKKSREKES